MTTASYTCPHCGAEFDSEEELTSHLRQAHLSPGAGRTLTCPVCDQEFGSQDELDTHGRIEHPGR